MSEWFAALKTKFINDFITGDRWQYLTNGLKITLIVTFFAVLLGIVLGFIVGIIRSTAEKTKGEKGGFGTALLRIADAVCKLYLTVIRGTPVVIQLMISYFIIFVSSQNSVMVACLTFGINSGAYVAEIVRSGIMSVDNGQFEAGRSLGFNYIQTMWYIIIPQAFKNVLPALGNEVIVLLKETSVSGYVGLKDLTKGGNQIIGIAYDAFLPLIAVAVIYLAMVMVLSWLVGKLERRLRASDH